MFYFKFDAKIAFSQGSVPKASTKLDGLCIKNSTPNQQQDEMLRSGSGFA
jgi:hypothetical protein